MNAQIISIADEWKADEVAGRWKPKPGDALATCEFARAGFRAYQLADSAGRWRLVITGLDAGSGDPRALLRVYYPGHDAAFGDLDGFVFKRAIGTVGGTNFNQAVKALEVTVGGSALDWQRRLDYLIARAEQDASGRSDGTMTWADELPSAPNASPYVFAGRARTGRTMSLFGPGSAGKTTLADGLIASLTSGQEIVPTWTPTRRYRVGVLDWDEGIEEEQVRLRAICQAYGITLAGGYCYRRMGRPLADVADRVGEWIVGEGIEVLFISPVGRALHQSERDPAGPVDELYEVLREFGTTNVLIDHVVGTNIKGGADREYGSVRKRDSARGSYSVYAQSEEPGRRVIVIRNTKPDAMAPAKPPHAVRIEYDPIWPHDDGTYDRISFHEDEVIEADEQALGSMAPPGGGAAREVLHGILQDGHRTPEQLADTADLKVRTVKTVLYRYRGSWFERLPSGAWEALPRD